MNDDAHNEIRRPRGNIALPRDSRDFVKGASSPIPYVVRNPSGDWTDFFFPDAWIEQLYEGKYDTDSCWLFHAFDQWEEQLEWLKGNGQFSQAALDLFGQLGLFDADGHWDLSRDYLAVLGGLRNNGGSQITASQLLASYGAIGASRLSYAGQDGTYQEFLGNFFDPSRVTAEMIQQGRQFLQYVNVAYEWIGDGNSTPPLQDMRASLLQSPLGIGIPIPSNVRAWNVPDVKYDGSRVVQHAVTLLAVNPDGSYKVLDQYNPAIKTLSADYYIPLVSNAVLTAAAPAAPQPILQSAPVPSLWASIRAFFRGS